MILKALLLAALVKLLLATEKPFLCSGIYAGVLSCLGLATGVPFWPLMLSALIWFGLSSLFFWLLQRYGDSMGLFWLIFALGIVVFCFV